MRMSRRLAGFVPLLATVWACGGSTSSGGGGGGGNANYTNEASVEPTSATCGSQPCSGCCDTAQTCQPGTADNACGTSGAACEDCAQSNATCSAGACSGSSSSSSSSGSNSGVNPGGGFPGFDGSFPFGGYEGGFPPPFGGLDGGFPLPVTYDGGGGFPVYDAGERPTRDAGRAERDAAAIDLDAGRFGL
jgi:hypothetical protein